ncbi:MAG TPA: glutamine-hydrolyzing GMP synthase [Defluviitaleaceae bacterium]|nr:glutamine-hydrolyzing GMP synthase [Defluviitaleaceae bacterium]
MNHELIIILDIDGKYNQIVARKVREANVYCEVFSYDTAIEKIKNKNPKGIIITGDSNNIAKDESIIIKELTQLSLPILVISKNFDAAEYFSEFDVEQIDMELIQSLEGITLIKKFLYDRCACNGDWNMNEFAKRSIESLKEKIADKKVLCALSGGVDSSVAAILVHKAVGKQLTCIFVDTGLMRKNERIEVEKVFRQQFDINLICIDAGDRFLGKLEGITDPERKRKIIGEEFIRVFEEEAKKIGSVDFLVQGTIYPDVIESGGKNAAVIKSHHNVGGLPDVIDFKEILEPLRDLFKDEVRDLGRVLGIPEFLVSRQPFPGPGLGVRIIGEITKEKVAILQEADYIFREELEKANLNKDINQYFAVLTNLRSVGVSGDERTYSYVVALRGVCTTDFMKAEWARIPYEVLDRVSTRIVKEVDHVNRIVYDITSKPPATIEWE